ncbi:Na+/H+ antiporter subunit E [Bacillus sp. B15-48]|uniref:Na+/H+ antiporter subunit E n=1 Tax=Bacillus sp. B15-48 TaxID=1548601 RepID=UPI00193FC9D2|nr:Na+/H+ antiporter subunit E [Bacillus sp. B15-48]MBM4760715.1 Na+/H+ antiporter subunit E [Bacillus sp. B15-48]
MAFQMLLNIFLAFTYMFMKTNFTLGSFVVGYFWGFVFLFIFRKLFNTRFYFHPVYATFKLMLLFLKALVQSTFGVVMLIVKPKLDIKPGIFALPIELRKDWEILLLSSLISLTPGTLTVQVSEDNSVLYIHAINIDDVKEEIDGIKNSFEKAILEVSR